MEESTANTMKRKISDKTTWKRNIRIAKITKREVYVNTKVTIKPAKCVGSYCG